jgi:hypothetical protein
MAYRTVEEGGWGWPGLANRAHYFSPNDAISICGRWAYTGQRTADDGEMGPNDCAACAKKLAKIRAKNKG